MAHRPPGRPKAREPRDIKVTIRLTEREADLLVRMANEASLSTIIRHALDHYMHRYGGAANLRDTERALIHRELRKAKRAASPEADALTQVFTLEEPAAEVPPVLRPQILYEETETVPVEVVDQAGRVIARGTQVQRKRPQQPSPTPR
jgi:hypothetical protein